ncbi:MAG: protein-L-isoaspartate O-methyltransferase [Rubrivivax sp.]|nr:protein-L-isoaspartate O-methyltransferase [Rubrivivax sp.]
MKTELARFNMIEQQIRPWDVLDAQVLALLAAVRREDFVPSAHKALAFVDTQVPLLPGQPHGPAMLEPKVEARLLQALQVQRHESVLEIGAGSGFMAALLGHRAQKVTSLECRPELAAAARQNLARAGLSNVRVVDCSAADGARGLPAEAPFDAIVLSGSVADVPAALLQQLKPGGRLVAVVGAEPVMRARLYTRTGEAAWAQTDLFDTVASRLEGFAEPTRFSF